MTVPFIDLTGGFKIPMVGLGTWQSEDEEELETALTVALENGYRHIDAAYIYHNEHVIGRVLKKWISSGKIQREDLFITTKLPMEGGNPDRVEGYLNKSLQALELDYVDLYLIHFPVCTKPGTAEPEPTDHIAIWKKMEEQVSAGRTKAIGVSNFNIKQIERLMKNSVIKPVCVQVEIHVFLPQNELVDYAQDKGMVVVAYSPLANPGINRFYAKFGMEPKEVPSILTDPTIKSIADKHGKSPAQIALKFLIQRNIVVIPKSVTAKRVQENIDLFDFTLDNEDMAALKNLEIGEPARVCDFSVFRGLPEHPEWPFPPKDFQ